MKLMGVVKSSSFKNSWSPAVLLRDNSVKKYCVKCGNELIYAVIYENGAEEEILHCSHCSAPKGKK